MPIVLVVVLALVPSTLGAQTDSAAAQLRAMQRTADSLRAAWDVLWKRSDSMRIESMFLRMRSDSIRREIAKKPQPPSDILPAHSEKSPEVDSAIVSALSQRIRSGRVSSGQTLSDTITRAVMQAVPDTGTASYYGEQFHGKKTSSGETFNMNDKTCAHRWLPYNTRVRVTNLENGKSVIVRVTDRGPFKHTRLLDVSKGAAQDLGMIRSGTARVAIEVVADSPDAPPE